MDYGMDSIKDIKTPSLHDQDKDREGDNEPQEAGQETFELETESKNDNLNGNDYLPDYEEELIVEPVLSVFEEDLLELKSDIEKEETDVEMDSGGYNVDEVIMERVYCDICSEYSYVTKSSFLHKLQSFCDKCYHNNLRKYKDEWMNTMYELYESCSVCMNSLCNSLDVVKHDCPSKNFYNCKNCSLIVDKKEDIERHAKMCVIQSTSLDYVATRKSIVRTTGLKRTSSSNRHLPKTKRHIVSRKEECVDNIKKKHSGTSSERKKNKHYRPSRLIKRYECSYCDKRFGAPSDLKVHLRIHTGEKPFLCELCNKSFIEPSKLKRHMRIHTGEKPFPCHFCKKFFTEAGSLRRHLRSHTGERPFSCHVCEKTFTQSCLLKRHLWSHAIEKPFPCKICNKSFSEAYRLKSHLRSHTGEKPFSCQFCKRAFSESRSLNRHLRIHTGKKPFSCQYCEELFYDSTALIRHLPTHSGEQALSYAPISMEDGHFLDLQI